jgi:D-alanine-D-alanine ligase
VSNSKVAILHNALARDAAPDEKDVLVQAKEVREALRRLGFEVSRLGAGLNLVALRRKLSQARPDVVFNLVESLGSSGQLIHLVPALLEDMQIAYTGAPVEGMFLSTSKLLAKQWLQGAGIPTPEWSEDGYEAGEGGGRWIIKPVWEDASIGVDDESVVSGAEVAMVLAARRRRYGGKWFAERYIEGREFNLSLLAAGDSVECLPVAEMCFVDYPTDKQHIVNYAAKWLPQSFEYHHTVRRFPTGESALETELMQLARRCWDLFSLRGYARVDLRIDALGQPFVLEVNANPCLSSDAGFAAALAEAGIDYTQAIGRIVDVVSRREPARLEARRTASTYIRLPQHSRL